MLTSNNLGCMCTTCSPFVVEIVAVPAIFSVLLQTSLTSPESPSSLAASDHPPSVCKSDQSVPHSIPNYMHTSYVQTAICCLLLMLWDYIRDLDYYYTGCVVVTWADCSLLLIAYFCCLIVKTLPCLKHSSDLSHDFLQVVSLQLDKWKKRLSSENSLGYTWADNFHSKMRSSVVNQRKTSEHLLYIVNDCFSSNVDAPYNFSIKVNVLFIWKGSGCSGQLLKCQMVHVAVTLNRTTDLQELTQVTWEQWFTQQAVCLLNSYASDSLIIRSAYEHTLSWATERARL